MDSPNFLDSLKDAWEAVDAPPASSFPDESSSPHLNSLIRSLRALQSGVGTAADARRELDTMSARLRLAVTDHDTLFHVPGMEDEVRVLAEATMAEYGAFGQGLSEVGQAMDDGSLAFEPGIERCKAAASRLEALHAEFAEIQKRESLSRCVMCSQLNLPQARSCARCGAALPDRMERSAATRESATSDLVMIPPEYVELYNACDAVAAGRLEVGEWRRRVDSLWQAFNGTRHFVEMQLARHSADMDGSPELRPVAEALTDGLATADAGLVEMARFEEDGDPEHLNEGWMGLLKGTRKVQESSAIFLSTLQALRAEAAQQQQRR